MTGPVKAGVFIQHSGLLRKPAYLSFRRREFVTAQPEQSTALILRERWAVDDPFLDWLEFMHDMAIYAVWRQSDEECNND
jgi:hypothetical protein